MSDVHNNNNLDLDLNSEDKNIPENLSFIQRNGNKWFHATTLDKAYMILTQGLIAPSAGDEERGIKPNHTWNQRTWTEESDHSHLQSAEDHLYLANSAVKTPHEIIRMLNDHSKIGVENYVVLEVDLSKIKDSNIVIDEDMIINPEVRGKAFQPWIEFLTKQHEYEHDISDNDYDHLIPEFNPQYEEAWVEFEKENPYQAHALSTIMDSMQEIHMIGFAGETFGVYNTEDEEVSLGQAAQGLDGINHPSILDLSAEFGSIAIKGNIHPDDIHIHPSYEKRYDSWFKKEMKAGTLPEIEAMPYAHIPDEQLRMDI